MAFSFSLTAALTASCRSICAFTTSLSRHGAPRAALLAKKAAQAAAAAERAQIRRRPSPGRRAINGKAPAVRGQAVDATERYARRWGLSCGGTVMWWGAACLRVGEVYMRIMEDGGGG